VPAKKSALTAAVVCVVAVSGLTGCVKSGDSAHAGHSGKSRESGNTDQSGQGRTDRDKVGSSRPDNGIAKLSAGQIGDKAVAAMKSASSVTLKGHIDSGGRPLSLHMSMAKSGDCTGNVGVGKTGTADVRQKNHTSYLKADSAFWKTVGKGDKTAATFAALLKDRWMKIPQSAQAGPTGGSDPSSFCRLSSMLSKLKGDDVHDYTKGSTTTVAGQRAVPLVKKKNGSTETAYIAAEGKPYILKLTNEGGSDAGTMNFSEFGDPVRVTAPPKRETLDLADVMKKSGGLGHSRAGLSSAG